MGFAPWLSGQTGLLSTSFVAIIQLALWQCWQWILMSFWRGKVWEKGRKGSTAQADYWRWGGKSTPVNLENPAEELAWVASWLLNVKCWNVVGLWRYVVFGKALTFGSGISLSRGLVPEFIIVKSFRFLYLQIQLECSCQSCAAKWDLARRNFKMVGWIRTAPWIWTGKIFKNGGMLTFGWSPSYIFGFLTCIKSLPDEWLLAIQQRACWEWGGVFLTRW